MRWRFMRCMIRRIRSREVDVVIPPDGSGGPVAMPDTATHCARACSCLGLWENTGESHGRADL